MIESLRALGMALVVALWPANVPLSPDAQPIVDAMASAVAADQAPALSGSEEEMQVGVLNAFLESGLHAHAEGDCRKLAWVEFVHDGDGQREVWHPETTLKEGFRSPADVPHGVVCASHGAWQEKFAAGRAALEEQATAWLAELRRSALECPKHPLASLASGGRGCSLGTHLSDYRMWRLKKLLETISSAGMPSEDARVATGRELPQE